MPEAAVVFDHVWKKFRRGERHDSFRDLVPALARSVLRRSHRPALERHEFWAVHDVSFEVREGDAVGIIGPNGAGKSTILKLLTRILRPTKGYSHVRGRVGALIEVAAGFHPDLTGRENVYLQGAIMGMKRAEIASKFDAIIEFSGVADFIDTPVKRYSSGMNARLGFSIAAHLNPDVLLIDEVLSVGDAVFQERCLARMRELQHSGIPMVFISHNLPAVMELCSRVIVMDHGTVTFDGAPAEAIRAYRMTPSTAAVPEDRRGPIVIRSTDLLDDHGESSTVFKPGGPLTVRITYHAKVPVDRPQFAVDIHRADGVYVSGINTRMSGRNVGTVSGDGHVDLMIPALHLLPGCYMVSVGILDGVAMRPIDTKLMAHPFSVASDNREMGIVHLEHAWRHEPERPAQAAAWPRPAERVATPGAR